MHDSLPLGRELSASLLSTSLATMPIVPPPVHRLWDLVVVAGTAVASASPSRSSALCETRQATATQCHPADAFVFDDESVSKRTQSRTPLLNMYDGSVSQLGVIDLEHTPTMMVLQTERHSASAPRCRREQSSFPNPSGAVASTTDSQRRRASSQDAAGAGACLSATLPHDRIACRGEDRACIRDGKRWLTSRRSPILA